jgi:hypothetical protein
MLNNLLTLTFTLLLCTHALASNCKALSNPQSAELEVTLPFSNQTIVNNADNSGLCFSYLMDYQSAICSTVGCYPYKIHRKIVCTLTNLENGWILYKDNGVTKETASDTGTTTITLSSTQPTIVNSPTQGQYHVDSSGVIAIHHLGSNDANAAAVTATCSYESEKS